MSLLVIIAKYNMETIVQNLRKFIEGHEDDNDWQYDMLYEFFGDLSRGDCATLADYLQEQFPSKNTK